MYIFLLLWLLVRLFRFHCICRYTTAHDVNKVLWLKYGWNVVLQLCLKSLTDQLTLTASAKMMELNLNRVDYLQVLSQSVLLH